MKKWMGGGLHFIVVVKEGLSERRTRKQTWMVQGTHHVKTGVCALRARGQHRQAPTLGQAGHTLQYWERQGHNTDDLEGIAFGIIFMTQGTREDFTWENMIQSAFSEEQSSLTIPYRSVAHYFCFPNSFCQNPAGSWIPQCHLWLLCDPALYSNRHPCPHHHLDWEWKCCECRLCGDLSGEDSWVVDFRTDHIFAESPWLLSLVPPAPPFVKAFQYFHPTSHCHRNWTAWVYFFPFIVGNSRKANSFSKPLHKREVLAIPFRTCKTIFPKVIIMN